jgi:hypothetical protein
LDAGDVVAAVESRGLAWRLGKWPPGPSKRRGDALEVEVALVSGTGAGGGWGSSPELGGGGRSSRGKQGSWRWTMRTWLQKLKNPGTPL